MKGKRISEISLCSAAVACILTGSVAAGNWECTAGGGAQWSGPIRTVRVSVSSSGSQGNNVSGWDAPSITTDGRYIVFESDASNLVVGDTNGATDVFMHDRVFGITELVSQSSASVIGNANSYTTDVSSDGNYIVFASNASNLVPNDTNGVTDVFVRDRAANITQRVSISSGSAQGNGASASFWDVAISGDGRYVAFSSTATNLVANDTNGLPDIFLHDRVTGTTEILSVSSAGTLSNGFSFQPSISDDGQSVAFTSDATNLATGADGYSEIFLRNRATSSTELITQNSDWGCITPSISSSGINVAFMCEPVNGNDIYSEIRFYNRLLGTTELLSVNSAGNPGNGWSQMGSVASISSDSRRVTFFSDSTNMSPSGNFHNDVFVRDRDKADTQLTSVTLIGGEGNWGSSLPTISENGMHVAFNSLANDLITGDTNDTTDVFVRGPLPCPDGNPPVEM